MALFGVLLAIHVILAVALLLPSLILPFLLRRTEVAGSPRSSVGGAVTRLLVALQGTGSVVIAIGVAASGFGLLLLLGLELLSQPWLLAALALYALNLVVATGIARPNIRRLLGGGADGERWQRLARRQRYVAYAMATAIGLIAFLMSTKPRLW